MNEATKYEFCSEGWVSLARDSLAAALGDADLEGVRFSFCEVFTDPPAHLLEPGASTTGWYVSVADGEWCLEKGVLPEADFRIIADYATMLPLARTVREGNPEGVLSTQKAVEAATAAGKLRREGDENALARVPAIGAFFAGLHDTLARGTL